MKVMTVLGTRPEIIRLSLIIPRLDKYCEHVLVHTGQNFEDSLNALFFTELKLRQPDYSLNVRGDSFSEQIGKIFIESEKVILKEKPERLLILGDTNSGLVSVIARRMGILVFHMEAGNRCYDDRVPEEVNRRVIDHSSTVLLPYTHRSKENLLDEGIPGRRIQVIGNPIYEVIQHHRRKMESSRILEKLKLKPQQYFLVTMHRAENVDHKDRLKSLLEALDKINKKYGLPVIVSLHPRAKNKLQKFSLKVANKGIRLLEPFGFFDFTALEKKARGVITDSGTVQEECCIFKVPNITVRDVTERPETLESGSNMLTGVAPEMILKALDVVLSEKSNWEPPAEYLAENVATRVVKIILGYQFTGL
jgi:UDP-N-acetylglucosamine 2-epimerase (non-hydrolysing)